MFKKFAHLIVACALLTVSSLVCATVIYDESVNGDAPGVLPGAALGTLALGTSTVIGATPGAIIGSDNDWFSFTIDVGTQLDAIILAAFTSTRDGGNVGWAIGNTIQDDSVGPFSVAEIGSNLLTAPNWNLAPPAVLGPGTYGFKTGTGTNDNTYSLDFVVSATRAVPEPATVVLLGLAAVGAGALRRRAT